jgi:hypothetical protein
VCEDWQIFDQQLGPNFQFALMIYLFGAVTRNASFQDQKWDIFFSREMQLYSEYKLHGCGFNRVTQK